MSKCPICFYNLDISSTFNPIMGKKELPKTGDITICTECTSILEFDKEMNLLLIEDEDFAKIDQETKDLIKKSRLKISENIINRKY